MIPTHSVHSPADAQLHRNDRGVGAALAAACRVPGAAASDGSAPMGENACGGPGATGAVSGSGPGAAVTCAKGWRDSLESLRASIRIGEMMSTVINSLNPRISTPGSTRVEAGRLQFCKTRLAALAIIAGNLAPRKRFASIRRRPIDPNLQNPTA